MTDRRFERAVRESRRRLEEEYRETGRSWTARANVHLIMRAQDSRRDRLARLHLAGGERDRRRPNRR